MYTLTMPQLAAILILGVPMQLPTPTPEPRIPLSDVESLLRAAASEARQLSNEQMLFIVGVILALAALVYLWKRPKTIDPESVAIAALDSTLKRYGTQYDNLAQERVKIIEESTRLRNEQDARYIESFGAMTDSITSLADATKALKENSTTTQALITQLMGREDKTATALQIMVSQGSEPLREVKGMVVSIQAITATMNESVLHIEGQQEEIRKIVDEIAKAIDALAKTSETCIQIAEDSGKVATVEPLEDEPKGKTA